MTTARFSLQGGIHPPQHKSESNGLPIAVAALAPRLYLPLRQHIGAPSVPVVEPGQHVLKGELIAKAAGAVSVALHAPTSGTVVGVGELPVAHPSGLPDQCLVLAPDGDDRWGERQPLDYRTCDRKEVLGRLQSWGIVGLGGAVFPTHIKVGASNIETLIINGAECEPWITSDDMLMRERAAEIIAGIKILQHLVKPKEVLVGIEDNKPEAIAAMAEAAQGTDITIVECPTVYPTGGEKQLIKVLTGKEVPSGGLPYQVGVVCNNVATAYMVHRAIDLGEPMVGRVVTVTGNVKQPRNLEVLLGTPLSFLLEQAGGAWGDTERYIVGGPMMGTSITNTDIPVVKGSNCFIAVSRKLFPEPKPAYPCIRCTRCAQACPAGLRPYEMYWFAKGKNYGKAQEYLLFDCIECGCCSFVCPSSIPLVQYFRHAKGEIWAREREKKSSDVARQRHEVKQARLEREKAERAAKHAKAAAAKKAVAKADDSQPAQTEDELKKAKIKEAMERAQQQKAATEVRNTDNLTPEVAAEMKAIDEARAKGKEGSHDAV